MENLNGNTKIKLKNKTIYQFLAIVVRITGRREKITLIEALKEALHHFPKKEGHYGEEGLIIRLKTEEIF